MQLVTVGPLDAILVTPRPVAKPGTPADNGTTDQPVQNVILLHGYGAPGTDLVGLAQQIPAPPGTRFIFLQAMHTLYGMTGPHAGRAWWHIDMLALQMARLGGKYDELAIEEPLGLKEAREALSASISALEKEHGLERSRTYIGGFSQGAMLSCDWVLRSEAKVAGLIQLSGTVICEAEWRALLRARAGLQVFQSHSQEDMVLPYQLAKRLAKLMTDADLAHTFVEFRGGHGIAPNVTRELGAFLSRTLS